MVPAQEYFFLSNISTVKIGMTRIDEGDIKAGEMNAVLVTLKGGDGAGGYSATFKIRNADGALLERSIQNGEFPEVLQVTKYSYNTEWEEGNRAMPPSKTKP